MGEAHMREGGGKAHLGAASDNGYCLADPALFEQQLAVAMLGVAAKRSQACSKRARAGALRAAQIWQPRKPSLRLSGVRVVGSASGEADEVMRTDAGMTEAMKRHWLPVFQAAED